MKTIFRSHELWSIVETGFTSPAKAKEEITKGEMKLHRENLVKDARLLESFKELYRIRFFHAIVTLETAKVAWDILKQEFVGGKHIRPMKLHGIRRDFKYTFMSEGESLATYLARLFDLINQIKSYGEYFSNQRIVQKLLTSLPKTYDSTAYVIENTKDIEVIDAQDMVAILQEGFGYSPEPNEWILLNKRGSESLKGYELRPTRHGESSTECAFASLNISPKNGNFGNQNSNTSGTKFQKNFKFKGKQWNNKSTPGVRNETSNTGGACKCCDRLHYGECWMKGKIKCHKCGKLKSYCQGL
ncbi:uncharacterized protein LOC125475449 [Pyrus x bretschneideri]|uniref:uncharacterized protein LOC125475449 n=1 Tax=Pyrus x bretschneideri TaxID=225117 RepID=UPI00202FD832|nr:uncharacterized protein LOC125475449 [Pyrus x bretschneideri]